MTRHSNCNSPPGSDRDLAGIPLFSLFIFMVGFIAVLDESTHPMAGVSVAWCTIGGVLMVPMMTRLVLPRFGRGLAKLGSIGRLVLRRA